MARLSADFSTAFSRDLKKKAQKRQWDLSKLKEVIELVIENSPASIAALKQRHNMHTLAGKWQGRNECHVANAGDWLVIWSCNGKVAFFERTGSHDELFGK
ncbi:addiction module toxin, RelE/StbE family [Bifidobacterium animalis subsp. animalis]|uniref:type II toxin-antitoxin system YafQ family toxin n=1 Tax=Bifidobacterium animalis TaxID=28025 RepID=UPI001020E3B4|nr:type II toxin-antitoxin system YafQ family toxin [Bifidobacterium animalis]RYN15352.1 addiction module toxin, RelE/StbE family [Bifidobacterium animalis subsp. animalis]